METLGCLRWEGLIVPGFLRRENVIGKGAKCVGGAGRWLVFIAVPW